MKAVLIVMLPFLIIMGSCERKTDLPDFDEVVWQHDLNGCKGNRSAMKDELNRSREHLKGLNQDEIIAVLGNPDKNELYKRNQKFFIYEISPAEACKSKNNGPHEYLSIRFNATGLAKEVLIYKE